MLGHIAQMGLQGRTGADFQENPLAQPGRSFDAQGGVDFAAGERVTRFMKRNERRRTGRIDGKAIQPQVLVNVTKPAR